VKEEGNMARGTDLIIDLHEDVAEHYMAENVERGISKDVDGRHVDFPKWGRAGARIVVASVYPLVPTWSPRLSARLAEGYGFGKMLPAHVPKGAVTMALEQLKVYYQMTRTYPDSCGVIQDRTDLEDSVKSKRVSFLLCLEGTEALEDASDLEVFYRLGVRAVGFTWNYDTRFAASCMSKKDYGLTGEGESLAVEANAKGVILDLAHSSKTTMLDALTLSKLPLMISHSNYSGVHPHKRNVDDDVLEALSRNGGVMGFTMINQTIGSKPGIDTLADHILSVRDRFGSDILAIGTDYLGIAETPVGLEDISKLKRLFEALGSLGMKDDEIRKLAWGNAYRVFEVNAQHWA
jgi:membrane dipeptidase